MASCGCRLLHRPSRRREDRTSSPGLGSFHNRASFPLPDYVYFVHHLVYRPDDVHSLNTDFRASTNLCSAHRIHKKGYPFRFLYMKKARDGAWHPVDAVFCTDRVGDEKIELRAQDWARFMQKGISFRISLCMKKARDGDRTRDPLLGKEVLHR